MLLDLMINNMSYNVKLATVIGVENAIYINALCGLLSKNTSSEDDYFMLDKQYITTLTGLPSTTQNSINKKLKELDIIDYDGEDKIKLNIQKVIDIICEEDKSKIKQIQKITKTKTASTTTKLTKNQVICNNLKEYIKSIIVAETPIGQQIIDAYLGWVDGVYANPKGFLSNKSVELFINRINEYSEGNVNTILELLDIATINGYRDAEWVINNYEQRPKKRGRKPISQNISENISLNNTEVF